MDTAGTKKIGIMGGTFDPIHYGHLLIAQSASEEFDLDQVIFLPTGKSPHKSAAQVTPPDIRCQMVQTAIADNPAFTLSDMEAKNSTTNYTSLTLEKFASQYVDTHFYFIMGEDSLNDFPSWREPQEICELASILVAVRNEDGNTGIEEKIAEVRKMYGADIHLLHAPNFSISSRNIREYIQTGKSVRYMIPDAVAAFITQNGLYSNKGFIS